MRPQRHITAIIMLAALSCGRGDGVRLSGGGLGLGLLESATAYTQVEEAASAQLKDWSRERSDTGGSTSQNTSEAELGEELGTFDFTYYWIAHQTQSQKANKTRTLYNKRCKPIAKVSRNFARRAALEGTGKLRDGRVVSSVGSCKCSSDPCFAVAGRKYKWGMGVAKRALSPFRSVAVDSSVIPIGQTLYLPELDGLTMPGPPPMGGWVHDGCVIADDRGGGVSGAKIDFFAAHRSHYRSLNKRHRIKSVTAFDGAGRCDHLVDGSQAPEVSVKRKLM